MARRKTVVNQETGETHEGVVLDVVEASEPFAFVKLEDGTTIRVKLVIVEAFRSDVLGPDGKPQFSLEGQLITNISLPEDTPQDE